MADDDLAARLSTLSSLTDPTRRRLYEYVRAQGGAVGRDEAAAATGLSRSLVAYHLDRLAEAGLLDVRYQRPEGRGGPGAGRPAKLYHRAPGAVEASVPERNYRLAAEALAEAVEAGPPALLQDALLPAARSLGRALASAGGGEAGEGGEAATALVALGYEPYVDAEGGLCLRNCLFRDLVEQHRELVCNMNLGLVEGILSGAGDAEHRAELDPGDDRCCVVIRARSAVSDGPPAG